MFLPPWCTSPPLLDRGPTGTASGHILTSLDGVRKGIRGRPWCLASDITFARFRLPHPRHYGRTDRMLRDVAPDGEHFSILIVAVLPAETMLVK